MRDYSKDYKKIRAEVKRRDKNKCILCGSKKRIEVHHIIPYSISILNREEKSNLCCLCKECHKMVTKNEHRFIPLLLEIITQKK